MWFHVSQPMYRNDLVVRVFIYLPDIRAQSLSLTKFFLEASKIELSPGYFHFYYVSLRILNSELAGCADRAVLMTRRPYCYLINLSLMAAGDAVVVPQTVCGGSQAFI